MVDTINREPGRAPRLTVNAGFPIIKFSNERSNFAWERGRPRPQVLKRFGMTNFQTSPEQYKHWKLSFDGAVARLSMDVQEDETLADGYKLKLNSYDLGVDIELADAVQRRRVRPEVDGVVRPAGTDVRRCRTRQACAPHLRRAPPGQPRPLRYRLKSECESPLPAA